MTAPRAVGRRARWADMPDLVPAFVGEALGSPVVAAQDQAGGFSPGCATRVRCADGTRAFVKAVSADLNPDTPTLFRRELTTLRLIGGHRLWADLLAAHDDGEWVVLVLEDVEGQHPDLGDDDVMARLLAATDELVAVLQDAVPALPPAGTGDGPPIYRPGLVDLREVHRGLGAALDRVPELPDGAVPAWLRRRRDELAVGVRALEEQPVDHLVHYDIRNDNLLQRPDGSLVFLDWGVAGVGPDWLDPLTARLERVETPWFDASLAGSPALARVGDDVVTSWLVGMGVHLAVRAHTAVDVNLPTLQAFRRQEAARYLGAAARRLGEA